MTLYTRREDRTDLYNDFMTKPDILCSKEHRKMKFWMAIETADYDNIPKDAHKLFGNDFSQFKESDDPNFKMD